LVPVVVDPDVSEALMRQVEADPTTVISIDVERLVVDCPAAAISASFPMDDFTRYRLVEGLDDIGLTLRNESAITAYEQRRPAWMPTITPR
ncbi:MAG: 3-isopropylmalate dehydratase small subunit, partial [Thermomicrobiales bacterium]